VGTQLPFDRLTLALDRLAPMLGQPVFGQIGRATYVPRNFKAGVSMGPVEFEQRFRDADIVVAHAGIGTVLKAQQHAKPLILLPRRASLGEHRNDHQLATCAQLRGRPGIHVADDEAELEELLLRRDLRPARGGLQTPDRAVFIANLLRYVEAA
jgi:UDP-N-acetylglucosamine transferase subunit ALG13